MISPTDRVYKKLRKHLDRQTIGFPATRSGAELRLLRHFFSLEEARLALRLGHQPITATQIYRNSDQRKLSFERVNELLEAMAARCTIGHAEKDGGKGYFLLPLVVGMYEGQVNRLTPQFIDDFDTYTATKSFGLSFLGSKLPQMRTIPVGKSITPEHHAATYDQLDALLNAAEGPFVINHCVCMQASELRGKKCAKTKRTERCLAIGNMAKMLIHADQGRRIDKTEALAISRRNEAEGLVLQPNNAQNPEFVCACCGCCCGILHMHKILPRPLEFWATNFQAQVNQEACTGCGICEDTCEVDAIAMNGADTIAIINPTRCIGCGNCVAACPSNAISLIKKESETIPPASIAALNQTNMQHKIGLFGKIRLAMRLGRIS